MYIIVYLLEERFVTWVVTWGDAMTSFWMAPNKIDSLNQIGNCKQNLTLDIWE